MIHPTRARTRLGDFLDGSTFQLLVFVLLFLVLYGAVPSARLAWLLVAFVVARSLFLLREAAGRRMTAEDWERRRAELADAYARLDAQDLEEEAHALGLEAAVSPSELARAAVETLRSRYVPPRARSELACELVGLLTFALIVPAAVLLHTRDFVSLRRSYGWIELGIAAICIGLYALPHTWRRTLELRRHRMRWWLLPVVPALALVAAGIALRHPYLDPFRPDRRELAAERVLALESNVLAGGHADWVFAYAEALEREDPARAAHLFREGLHLDPTNDDARARLARLDGTPDAGTRTPDGDALRRAREPLWKEGEVATPVPRCAFDRLGQQARTVVVLVRLGDFDDALADAIGNVIERELQVPTCLAESRVTLPPHTRTRGVLFGRQWSERSLILAFDHQNGDLPRSAAKFLLLTSADIYGGESNFVFSSSYGWGALVSTARFEMDPQVLGGPSLVERAAKQALGAIVKGFGLQPSSDPLCVTSYSNGLPQFDAKGNRPTVETLAAFRERLRHRDDTWRAQAGAPAASEGR